MQTRPSLIFIQKLVINNKINLTSLHGEVRFIDSHNHAHICAHFHQGTCLDSQVFIKKNRRLKNCQLTINHEKRILISGKDVQQYSLEEALCYKGEYFGFYRHGLGEEYKNKHNKVVIQKGIWVKGNKYGRFIQRMAQKNDHKISINDYENDTLKKVCHLEMNNGLIQQTIKYFQENNGQQACNCMHNQEQIAVRYKSIQQEWNNNLKKLGESLDDVQNFSRLKMGLCFDAKVLQDKKEGGMLSEGMCEIYLDYISHLQPFKQSRTLIINQYISDLINKYLIKSSSQKDKDSQTQQLYSELKRTINNHMKRYRKKYNLWGGMWKAIIMPFIINHHFCFLSVKIDLGQKGIKCFIYDSGSVNLTCSRNILTQFLDIQLKLFLEERKSQFQHEFQAKQLEKEYKSMITNLQIQEASFPKQKSSDKESCGVFMLCGIADLIQWGQIQFKESHISERRSQILKKLYQKYEYFKLQ